MQPQLLISIPNSSDFIIDGGTLFVDNAGSVGVGTTAPSSTLDVVGTFAVSGTSLFDGSFTLGDGGDTGSINTSDWDISTTGVLTGISIDANGAGNSITNIDNADLTNSSVTVTAGTGLAGGGVVALGDTVTLTSILGESIDNAELVNSVVTVNAGTGLTGGGLVSLGGAITLNSVFGESIDASDLAADTIDFSEIADNLTLDAETTLSAASALNFLIGNNVSLTATGTGSITATDVAADAVTLGTDTTGNYVATVADAGNSTITVSGSGSEDAAVTLDVVDVNCTDCLNATEIEDIFVSNTGDTIAGTLDIAETFSGTTSDNVGQYTLTNSTSSGTQNGLVIDNAASSGTTEALLVLDNSDTDTAVTTAFQIVDAGGGFTNLFDVDGTLISESEFTVLDGGITFAEITDSGTLSSSSVDIDGGSIDGTAIGATTPSSGAFTTLSSTGVTTLGDGSSTVAINSSSWDISSTGVITGVTIDANAPGNSITNIDNADLTNSSVTVTAGTGLAGGGVVALGDAITLTSVLGDTVENAELVNSAVTVTAGTGLTGGGLVSLGGSITLNSVFGESIDASDLAADTIDFSEIADNLTLDAETTLTAASALNFLIGNNVSLTTTGTGTITATDVTADSVALGGDTTGDYVESLTQGTGITISGGSGEGSTPTITATLGTSIEGSEIATNTIDFNHLVDSLSLDATTTIDLDSNSSDLIIDGGTLFVDNAGSVGIGTTAPSSTLDVVGTFAVSGTALFDGAFTLGDGGDTGSINTSDWDISTTGVLTGISIDANGAGNTITNIDNADLTNSSVTVTAGTGLSGGGLVALGDAITLNSILGDTIENGELANSSLTVTAGSGLTDGGAIALGGSGTLNIGAGDGITVNADDVAVNLLDSVDGTGSTSANSGLEFQGSSSDELSLLQGCSNNEVLKWNDTTSVWACSADQTGGGTGTLDDAYNNGGTITVDAYDVILNLNDSTNDYGQLIDNTTNATIDTALEITTTGGASSVFTTALDLSDDGIVNALDIGTNNIVTGSATIASTELDVLDGGIAFSELTDSGTLTVTTVDINGGNIDGTAIGASTPSSGAFTTLSSTGITTIGDGSATVAIDSSDWDISTTGTLTGISFDANGVGNSITNIDNADLTNSDVTVAAGTGLTGGGLVALGGSVTLNSVLGDSIDNSELDNSSVTVTAGTGLSGGGLVALGDAITLTSLLGDSISNGELVADTIDFDSIASSLTLDEETTISAGGALNLLIGNNVTLGTTGTGIITASDVAANSVVLGTDTTGNYVATVADAGNSTITVSGSGSEDAAVTLDVVDVNCTDCLNATEIEDIFVSNTGDVIAGTLDIAETFSGSTSDNLGQYTVTNSTSSGTQNGLVVDNAASTGTTESLLVLDNSDTDTAVTTAFQIIDAGGGFTNLFDVGGTLITESEFTVLDGGITYGELTDSGTFTAGTVDINGGNIDGTAIGSTTPSSGAFTTLSSTGITTIGDGSATVAIDSSDWDISATGVLTGFSFDANGAGNSISNIDNADLTNSDVTVAAGTGLTGGGLVSLGGTITLNSILGESVANSELDNSSVTVTAGTGLTGGGLVALGDAITLNSILGASIENSELAADTVDFDRIADSLSLDAETTISAASALNLLIGNNVTLTTTGTGSIEASSVAADSVALGTDTTV